MLGLSACGESAAQQFRDSLRPLQQQVQSDRSQIAATLQSVTLHDAAGSQELDREIGTLAHDMAAMTKLRAPGTAAQRAFASYNAANVALVAQLRRVAAVVAHGSSGELQTASVAATDAAGAIQRASDAMNSALGP